MKTKMNNSAATVAGPVKDTTTTSGINNYRELLAAQILHKELSQQLPCEHAAVYEILEEWKNSKALGSNAERCILYAARAILLFDETMYGDLAPHIIREHDHIILEAIVD